MIASSIIPGRSYVDRHGNIFRVREIQNRRVYFNIDGIHLLPLASSGIDGFAAAMVTELNAEGQRDE
ncbi:hypothetical protein ASG19_12800 [Rhizobium sp. Leaf306]|uniref:DUF4222 domain-containing protein n=1 Tax=Rhizobium sp. Leaf306 TaxID=1736330 RepID=UPI000714E554|nr:DUF4222 domain-containing protein [Rhizobium sp. Leaf306]KQQ37210.1 hypothetical protein ASG19_12800 [Rhizobium sp. Leaf306]